MIGSFRNPIITGNSWTPRLNLVYHGLYRSAELNRPRPTTGTCGRTQLSTMSMCTKKSLFSTLAGSYGGQRILKVTTDGPGVEVYRQFYPLRAQQIQQGLESEKRFQKIHQREHCSDLPTKLSRCITFSKSLLTYRGIMVMKGTFDQTICSQLLWHVKPTIYCV